MTIDEVKVERDRLRDALQLVISPLIEEFERETGVVAQIRTDHLDVTTHSDARRRYRVDVRVMLDWEM